MKKARKMASSLMSLLFGLTLATTSVQADYLIKDGNGNPQTISAFSCGTGGTKICPGYVPMDLTGAAFGVTANPFYVAPAAGAIFPMNAAAGSYSAGAFVAGTGVDCWDGTQGCKGDAVYPGSGSASVVSILKGIYGSLPSGTLSGGATFVTGTTASPMTGTASTQVVAAVANKRLYITRAKCNDSSPTTSTMVLIQDGPGGATLDTLAAGQNYGGEQATGVTPLFWTTAGNGLYAQNLTTGASVICTASGYSG